MKTKLLQDVIVPIGAMCAMALLLSTPLFYLGCACDHQAEAAPAERPPEKKYAWTYTLYHVRAEDGMRFEVYSVTRRYQEMMTGRSAVKLYDNSVLGSTQNGVIVPIPGDGNFAFYYVLEQVEVPETHE